MVPRAAKLSLGFVGAVALLVLLPHAGAEARVRSGCRPQKPQRFLMRSHYVKNGMIDGKAHAKAVQYRAERYGSIPGFDVTESNPKRVADQVVSMKFFGLPIVMHEKVAPALSCVEQRIKQRCRDAQSRYVPRAIGGLRTENTIRQGELSNHLFGIAIDIDPNRNPCCHCVQKWQGHKKCAVPVKSAYERADLPRCWISAFEHFGFHWLGHDRLEDTMHFEFLGNPDRK
jgi:hypothetical protein